MLPVVALLRFFIDVSLLFFKQSLQAHLVRSCRDTYVFYAMYNGLCGDIKSFQLLIFVWIKIANYVKNKRRHFDKMNVNRNIKVPDLILSILLLSKTDFGLKRFFAK